MPQPAVAGSVWAMSIPTGGYPRTATVSPRVQVVESTGSTNADVVRHVVEDPEEWPHLSMLLTTDQRAGRGRLDRSWVAPPDTALAVSVVVRVGAIPVAARGWIPLIAGAAMTRAVKAQLAGTGHFAALKWPNDVLLDGLKVCGILAEVVPGHPEIVVVGSGVNTRMQPVDLPVSTATSFAAVGLECDEDRLLADYLTALDDLINALGAAQGSAVASGVLAAVQAECSTIGSEVAVSLPDGEMMRGRATRIDEDGRLVVEQDSEFESAVSAGDVVHVR